MTDPNVHDWLDRHGEASPDDSTIPPDAAAWMRLRQVARGHATADTDRVGRVRMQAMIETALAEPVDAPVVGEILTPDDLARYLKLPPDAIDATELPGFVVAGRLRFRKSRIDQWIAEQERLFSANRAREIVQVG